MFTTGHLDLSERAVSGCGYLRSRLDKLEFARFKSMTRSCPTAIHIPEKVDREAFAHIAPLGGFPPRRAVLTPAVYAQAQLYGEAAEERELLAAASAGHMGPDLSLLVRKVSAAEAGAIFASPFATAAKVHTFPLSVFTLLTGTTSGGNRALIGSALDSIPAQALVQGRPDAWMRLALEGLAEPSMMRLEYSGLAVDTLPIASGRMTIIGLAAGPVKVTGTSGSFEPLGVGFERDAIADVVRSSKGIISTGMQLALSIIGYREWGPEFLRLAVK